MSDKQLAANRANAQHSTGPSTPEGKANSATNGLTHGLNATPETLFAAHPELEQAFKSHAIKLRKDCQPESDIEDEAFLRYAWSTFQAKRARNWELTAEDRWLNNPEDAKTFTQLERTLKLTALLERRADKAMRELRQLQKDRFAAYEVYAEHCVMGKEVHIPKSLPTAEIRKSNLGRTSPNYIAQFLMYQMKEVKATARQMLRDAKTKPTQTDEQSEPKSENPFQHMGVEELLETTRNLLKQF